METQQQPIVMQPQAAVIQPQAVVIKQQNRPWKSGLWGCMDDFSSCCFGCFCFPCLICSVAHKLGENCCVPMCLQGGIMATRSVLRTLYGIQGSMCDDWCVTCCCPLLAVCQMDRELKLMGIQ